ncbi:unnamed protein product [Oikopleura dioica]|uniref:Uncharacterized protein n=1 Tax=Oikopleura dioica TaxID=34765 RepID=E4YEJ3_OIKDI|nr:unnamed protein product [Oikopleura dioica]
MLVDDDTSRNGETSLESDVEAFHSGDKESMNIDKTIENLFANNPLFKIKRSTSHGSMSSEKSSQEFPKSGSRRGTQSYSDLSIGSNGNNPLSQQSQSRRSNGSTTQGNETVESFDENKWLTFTSSDSSSLLMTDSLVTRKASTKRKSNETNAEYAGLRQRADLNRERIVEETEEELEHSAESYEFKRAFSGIAKPRTNSTPYKKRRTVLRENETVLPSPIRSQRRVISRRYTFSGSENTTTQSVVRNRSDSESQKDAKNSPRLSRAAKTKASNANKELMTSVYGNWESSIEESTSGSIAEDIRQARQDTENWNDDEDFFAWNEYTDGEKDKLLFTDEGVMEKLRPHEF